MGAATTGGAIIGGAPPLGGRGARLLDAGAVPGTMLYSVVGCDLHVANNSRSPLETPWADPWNRNYRSPEDGQGYSVSKVLWIDEQADLDELEARMAHCPVTEGGGGGWRVKDGGIFIFQVPDVTDLEALRHLRSLGRSTAGQSLVVEQVTTFTSLDGLRNLHGPMLGALGIRYNKGLTSLRGLDNVTSFEREWKYAGNAITIEENDKLASVEGLKGLRGVLSGALRFDGNPELVNLDGLEGITGIDYPKKCLNLTGGEYDMNEHAARCFALRFCPS